MLVILEPNQLKYYFSCITGFFLLASVFTSIRFGIIPGFLSAILGFSTISFFYIFPYKSLNIDSAIEGITLSIFLVSAVIASLTGAFSRATNQALIKKEKRLQALYKIHTLVSNVHDKSKAIKVFHQELKELLEMDVVFFFPDTMNTKELTQTYPTPYRLEKLEQTLLKACWGEMLPKGLGTKLCFESMWRFEPMVTINGEMGVMAVKVPDKTRLDASFGRLLSAIADQIASALERIELMEMMNDSRIREEREKLRALLLSSVSHDLKTPLASVIGSLSVYQRINKHGRLDAETAEELVTTSLEEAQRLDSFISNILDMTRIESGDIEFEQDWINANAPIAAVKKCLRQRLTGHKLVIEEHDNKIELLADETMTEQVLQNIVDNAVKYSPKDTEISITYQQKEGGLVYSVKDNGPGIPDDKLEAIFDKYERINRADSQVAGTGLGLAISKAVMEKQGGTITVRNHPKGGAEFNIWFPKARTKHMQEG